jgi:hypothetical protein
VKGVNVDPESNRGAVRTNRRRLIRTGPGGRTGILIQTASLLLTGITFALGPFGSGLPRFPLGAVVAGALLFAFLACTWSAIITAGLYLIASRRDTEILAGVLRTASVAIWFAPATILFARWSPASAAAAMVLVVTATRLLYSEWHAGQPRPAPEWGGTLPIGILGRQAVRAPLLTRDFVTGIVTAVSIHFAATSAMFRYRAAAGALFVLSAALLTYFAMTTGAVDAQRPRSLPQSLVGMLLTIFLAAGVTVSGLRPRLFGGDGDSSGDAGGQTSADRAATPGNALPQPSGLPPDGSFPGVILWPEIQPVTRLIAPIAPRGNGGISAAQTYSIPFGGEYWLFRWPYRKPPAKSYLQRGTPVKLSFSTVDKWPLQMEAHQRLDPPVDLSCCGRVRLQIWNADRYPGTLSLELSAVESGVSRALGIEPVRSTPLQDGESILPASETLEYSVPAGLGTCSELTVVYRRAKERVDKSARVAIDRFVLAP